MDKNSIYESFNEFDGKCSDFAIKYLKEHYLNGYGIGIIDIDKGAQTLWNIIDKYITNVNDITKKDDIKNELETELDSFINNLCSEELCEEDKKEVKVCIETALVKETWIKSAWKRLKKILNIGKVVSKDDFLNICTTLDMRDEDREAMEHAFRQIEIAEVINKIDEKNISKIKYQFISDAFFSPLGSEKEMTLQKICAVDILCQYGQVSDVSAEENPCVNALVAANFMYDKISELKLGLIEAVIEAALMKSNEELANN